MKKIIMLVVSVSLMIVGIIIFNTRNVDSIFAYNEIITQESKQYYEYTEESDGTLSTRELSKQDYDISVAVEKLRREEQASYKVVQEGGNRYQPIEPPFVILPNIILSGVNYNGSTTGSVTVTYQYATVAYYQIGNGGYTSFTSGTVFSDVGSYTIFCSNSDGDAHAYFSIVANTVVGNTMSFQLNTVNTSYEALTTTLIYANSWNYIQMKQTCVWSVLPNNGYRNLNMLNLSCYKEDFVYSYQHTSYYTASYQYTTKKYYQMTSDPVSVTQSASNSTSYLNFSSETGNAMEDTGLIYIDTGLGPVISHETNNLSAICPIEKDYGFIDGEDFINIVTYDSAVLELVAFYDLRDSSATISTYDDYAVTSNGSGVISISGSNSFGWSSSSISNNAELSLGLAILSILFIPVPVLGTISSVFALALAYNAYYQTFVVNEHNYYNLTTAVSCFV